MKQSNPLLKKRLLPVAGFAFLIAGLVAINVLAGLIPLRLDITEEGLYTLSEGSKKIIAGLDEPVSIKYYFSDSLGQLPVVIKTYAVKVRELLEEYASESGGNITLEVYDPKPDTDEEEWAKRYGLKGAQLPNGTRLTHGLVVLSGGKEKTVPFFDPRREKFLEYDISEALTGIKTAGRSALGVISFLPVMGQPHMPNNRPVPSWAFIEELKKRFDVQSLTPDSILEIPENLSLVMVIHPKAVTDKIAYALDQFLLRGGRLMVFLDPFSRSETSNPRMMRSDLSSNLTKLLPAWKIKFDSTKVVADLEQATRVNSPGQGLVNLPVWISVRGKSLNKESIITSQLGDMILIDAGAIEKEEGFNLEFTPLISSSANSGTVESMIVRMSRPLDIAKSLTVDGKKRVLAALISGSFDSAFPQGPPKDKETKPEEKSGANNPVRKLPHLAKAQEESSVLIVGDADFLHDRYSVQAINFFGQRVLQPLNDNLNFILNAAEYMTGSNELIQIRSRGQFTRPFLKLTELQMAAQQKYQTEERRLTASLESVREKLQELEKSKEKGKAIFLSSQQKDTIKKFRLEEQGTSRALRDVRKVLRQDIESLGNYLMSINLLVMPFLVSVFGFTIIIRRSKRTGGRS